MREINEENQSLYHLDKNYARDYDIPQLNQTGKKLSDTFLPFSYKSSAKR